MEYACFQWDSIAEAELQAIEFEHALSKKLTTTSRPSPSSSEFCHRRLPNSMAENTFSETRQEMRGFDSETSLLCHRSQGKPIKVMYPVMKFRGQIVYCRTSQQVEKAASELLSIVADKKKNMEHVSLGFDIEWRPSFLRGEAQRKASVMQICTGPDVCYVMHIIHSGISPLLCSLLEDKSSVKVGVCIAGDAAKILRDYNVIVKNIEDLSMLANVKLGGVPRMWGLCSLLEAVTCKQLLKPKKLRLGNWETSMLSKEQLEYAATDAYVSWYLYEGLKDLPSPACDGTHS